MSQDIVDACHRHCAQASAHQEAGSCDLGRERAGELLQVATDDVSRR